MSETWWELIVVFLISYDSYHNTGLYKDKTAELHLFTCQLWQEDGISTSFVEFFLLTDSWSFKTESAINTPFLGCLSNFVCMCVLHTESVEYVCVKWEHFSCLRV